MARRRDARDVPLAKPQRIKCRVFVAAGLSRAEALQRARLKLPYRYDYRGFSYNPVTGEAAFV